MTNVLSNRSFRYLWLAGLISVLGSQITRIGLILYVSKTGAPAINLALLVVLEMLPGAIAAPLAGVVVDKFNRHSVLIASEMLQAIFVLMILVSPGLSVIYLMAALHSIAAVFFQPAKAAVMASLVGHQDLPEANGVDQSAYNLVLILGPVAGTYLMMTYGLGPTLLIDAMTFLLSACLISRLKVAGYEHKSGRVSFEDTFKEIKEGWGYLSRNRIVRYLNLLLFMDLFCTGMWLPLAPFFIRDRLGASEELLGWQLSVFGLGAIIGGMIAPVIVRQLGAGLALFMGMMAEGASLALYALVSDIGASMAIILMWGVMLSFVVVPFYSILQMVVENRFLGRIFSVTKQSENLATVMSMAAVVMLERAVASYIILFLAGLFYVSFAAASLLSRDGRTLLATR